jgi:uncharacterized protein YeaO (DUF488 family)
MRPAASDRGGAGRRRVGYRSDSSGEGGWGHYKGQGPGCAVFLLTSGASAWRSMQRCRYGVPTCPTGDGIAQDGFFGTSVTVNRSGEHIMIPLVVVKRIYEPVSANDGMRILVDRIWPRGVTRERAALTLWLKDIAPTAALRKWYSHKPARWVEFQRRYIEELSLNQDKLAILQEKISEGTVTLLYAARDADHSHALVLLKYLSSHSGNHLPRR